MHQLAVIFSSCLHLGSATQTAIMVMWFGCPSCPLADACNATSFKKANCWAQSEDDARLAVKQHLIRSSHHFVPEPEAEILSAEAQIDVTEVDDEAEQNAIGARVRPREQEVADQEAKKLRREGQGKGYGKGKGKWAAGPSVHDVVAETLRQVQAAPHQPLQLQTIDTLHSLGSSMASVTIRHGQMQQAVDAVGRASTAAKQAQRLCSSAARAFGDESLALDECKNLLESILNSAT